MNREVFLSILAMDSYQRGYAPGIIGLNFTPNITKIGNATILADSPRYQLTANGEAVGFYASAYQWGTETVISYRGTDFDAGNELVHDFVYGWSSFTGLWKASQFPLASQFYTAVTGRAYPVGNEVAAQNITTVGHSLGGALAGLVSTLSGVEAIGFDYMPFASAAFRHAIYTLLKDDNDADYLSLVDTMRNSTSFSVFSEFMTAAQELRRLQSVTPEAYGTITNSAVIAANDNDISITHLKRRSV